MAIEFLNFHLHVAPTSLCNAFPAKIQASIKPQFHESRITYRSSSRLRPNYINRNEVRSVDTSDSSIERLLYCVRSGNLKTALQVFGKMTKSKTFVWNVMIRGLVDSGMFEEAMRLYCRMINEGVKADKFTYPFVIKACSGVFGLKEGKNVHSTILKLGFHVDIYVCNALIVMYAKAGCVGDSEKMFRCMPVRDLVTWNSMISGHLLSGDGKSALICLQEMQKFEVELDRFSYIGALNACAIEGCLLSGKEIFCRVIRHGFELDSMIQSSVIDMFGKCREVSYAERFCNGISRKNVVVWNSMIGAYALNNAPIESFCCLKMMQEDDDVKPDSITLMNLLPSCSNLGSLLQGRSVHGYAVRNGYLSNLALETSLIDMYGKCGSINLTESVFLRMKEQNIVAWNAMIAAYVQNSYDKEAVKLFQDLQLQPYVPDDITFSTLLAAYSEIALPKEGKQIHGYICKSGASLGTLVSNSMVNMYAKCGDLETARKVFNGVLFKDVVSWNTIIMAYAVHGYGEYCSRLFYDMINEGFKPNGSTFASLLLGCSVAGLVDEGWRYFDSMKKDYELEPGIEHFGCMLDLIGRSGDFERAKRFIEEMPLVPTHRIWGSLLAASRHHRNVEIAELAANHIFSLNNDNAGCYVLLSNIYAEAGRLEDAKRVKLLMKKRGFKRRTSCSIVECNGETYRLKNYDKSEVYDVLDILSRKMGEDLYVWIKCKFKPANVVKARGTSPLFHSVRLAICQGLIGTTKGKAVIVRKNVRICEDCHVAAKKMSLLTKREIVVGDSKKFHHFRDGVCSCGDYW